MLLDDGEFSLAVCSVVNRICLNDVGTGKLLSLPSSIHILKIRMTSHPFNKYEQITLSYLLSFTGRSKTMLCNFGEPKVESSAVSFEVDLGKSFARPARGLIAVIRQNDLVLDLTPENRL